MRDDMIDGDWVLVLGWTVNATLSAIGIFERLIVYSHNRDVENDPDLPEHLRPEASLRRTIAMRRVWLKIIMFIVCTLELAVFWDRWWSVAYDHRDVIVCLTMTAFLIWMLTWRDP